MHTGKNLMKREFINESMTQPHENNISIKFQPMQEKHILKNS